MPSILPLPRPVRFPCLLPGQRIRLDVMVRRGLVLLGLALMAGIFCPSLSAGGDAIPAASGQFDAGTEDWIPLQRLSGSWIGVIGPAGSRDLVLLQAGTDGATAGRRAENPGAIQILEPYDPDAVYLLVSRGLYDRLQEGILPAPWTIALAGHDAGVNGGAPPSSQILREIPALADDGVQVLIRLPESMRPVLREPGGRVQPLPAPEETLARRSAAAEHPPITTPGSAPIWRPAEEGAGPPVDLSNPLVAPPVIASGPRDLWQSLADGVRSDRLFDDLDYLSTTLQTRYYSTPQMDDACQYALEEFQALGLQASYDPFTYNGHPLKNVLAVKPGTVDPGRIYLICGHLDSTSPDPQNTAPGAEDNGSGSAAVLEAARMLAGVDSDYTIYFLLVSAEEQGLIGSSHFADQAAQQGLDIRAVLNMDMIGYYEAGGDDLWLEGFYDGVSSVWLMDLVEQVALDCTDLSVYRYPGNGFGSDHVPFHNNGYPAILSIENEWDSYPCYHATCDRVEYLDADLWRAITAVNTVALAQLAQVQAVTGGIEGLVEVSGGGDPTGALVNLQGTGFDEVVLGPDGAFDFSSLFPGTYLVTAEKHGYVLATAEVVVESDQTPFVQLTLEPLQPGAISGLVLDESGTPVQGARIEAEGFATMAVSQTDGSYTLGPLWPGEITLSAAAPDLTPRGLTITLDQGEQLTGIDFVLEPVWDFEGGSEDLVSSAGWEWGSDATAGAHSGSKVWGTRLNANYANCADYPLDLPAFSLGSFDTATLQLWTWYDAEADYDGGNLQVSTDGGSTWTVVEPDGGYDGFMDGSCNPLDGQQGFQGVTSGWVEKRFSLDSFLPHWIRVRLHFGADGGVRDRGWYVDDIALEGQMTPVSVEPGVPLDLASGRLSMRVSPNPAIRGAVLELRLPSEDEGGLSIFDPQGRRVAEISPAGRLEAGLHRLGWDGSDNAGRPVPAGVYWARWDGRNGAISRTVVVVR